MTSTPYKVGTVIHGTMRHEDLVPAFADELERIAMACGDISPGEVQIIAEARAVAAGGFADEDYAAELAATILPDALHERAPFGLVFGPHPGDGSDYGWWIDQDVLNDSARDGGNVFMNAGNVWVQFGRHTYILVPDTVYDIAKVFEVASPTDRPRLLWSV